jgi:DNA polymerase I-like protein with 3'-5' exonuclease and polymerase domains
MVHECYERYLKQELAEFKGDIIYGLGAVALQTMMGKQMSVTDYQGSIFEYGEMVKCPKCEGTKVIPGKPRNCPQCKGKGHMPYQDTGMRCPYHRQRKGKIKPKDECSECWHVWKVNHKLCENCVVLNDYFGRVPSHLPVGKVPGPDKTCKYCHASGEVPSNPDKQFVCRNLREGQLFVPTLHPAYLMRDATQFPVVERDFARMHQLREELVVESQQHYVYSPTEDEKTKLLFRSPLSLDLETAGGLKPEAAGAKITVMSVSPQVKESYLVRPGDPCFDDILDSPYIIGQNWMIYDAWWVWRKRGRTFNKLWDTRLGGHLLNPDTPNTLVYLSREFAVPPARGYWKTTTDYSERKDHVALVDADVAYRVKLGQYDAMAQRGILDIMDEHIMPLCNVLFDMRRGGMRLDTSKMEQTCQVIKVDLDEGRNRLPAWEPTASGQRTENQPAVREHLYETLRLPPRYTRKDHKLTSDKDALRDLKDFLLEGNDNVKHLTEVQKDEAISFIDLLGDLKGRSKLYSEFNSYNTHGTEWVHPILNPAGTGTFRFSGIDPNVQKIPKCRCSPKCYGTNPECRGARHVFIPDEKDWLVLRFDLAQAEVVTFLWYAQAWDVLNDVLRGGTDAHEAVGKALGQVRDRAKISTFAVIYGEQPETTAARNAIPLQEVMDTRDMLFKLIPGVEAFREHFIHQAMNNGFVETPFRTRRYIRVNYPYGRAANQAGNAPVQSVPPWVLRLAMIKLHRDLPKPARLWNQVHDEIDIITPPDLVWKVIEIAHQTITSPVPELPAEPIGMASGLRFASDIEIGPNWGALKPLEEVKDQYKWR